MGRPAKDMVGECYGMLTVIAKLDQAGNGAKWDCMCACGRHIAVRRDNLVGGNTKSCGQCGAFHMPELTPENATFLVYAQFTPDMHRGNRFGFSVVRWRESGLIAVAPKYPVHVADPLGTVLFPLARAGLIKAKGTHKSNAKWAQTEKVMLAETTIHEPDVRIVPLWERVLLEFESIDNTAPAGALTGDSNDEA